MVRSLIPLALLVVCSCAADSKDESSRTGGDSGSVVEQFENEMSVGPLDTDVFGNLREDGDEDNFSYFPLRHYFWPVGLVAIEAPEPPYEIRELSAWVLAGANANCNEFDGGWDCIEGADCNTTVPMKLVAYVGEAPPRSFAGGEADLELPDVPYIASIEVSGGYGSPGTWDSELLTGVFDEPILVEESGPLWIGYAQATESGPAVACGGGYTPSAAELSDADLDQFVWWGQNNLFTGGGTGWELNSGDTAMLRPLVQAVLGY